MSNRRITAKPAALRMEQGEWTGCLLSGGDPAGEDRRYQEIEEMSGLETESDQFKDSARMLRDSLDRLADEDA